MYDELGVIPLIQVHDELDCSVKDERQANQIKEVMETCVDLQVPSKVDVDQAYAEALAVLEVISFSLISIICRSPD